MMAPRPQVAVHLLLYHCLFASIVAFASGLSLGNNEFGSSRRDLLVGVGSSAAAAAVAVTTVSGGAASASASASAASSSNNIPPIAVIGASGRTGSLCVASCLRRGIPVRALTRSGEWQYPDGSSSDPVTKTPSNNNLLSIQACDARDTSALTSATQGCSAVIYAASASKKGGMAKEIDNEAVVSAGKSCISNNVARYVVISSTATTRPQSLGYKFTNVYQNIMAEKRLGELGIMEIYGKSPPATSSSGSYTIIRPGGLEEPKRNVVMGPSTLELSQGDVLAGVISRADLAEVAVEAALSRSANLQNASFELYYTDSAQPCEKRFRKLKTSGEVPRLHGDSYEALFANIRRDGEYFVPQ